MVDEPSPQQIRDRGRAFLAAADVAADALEAARAGVVAAADTRRNALVWGRLDALPLGALREAGASRVRLGTLEAAGLTTVGAVLRLDEHRLDTEVAGVGPATARQVLETARGLYHAVAAQARVLPDPSAPDAAGTALLAALHRYGQARTALGPAVAATAQVREHLHTLLPTLDDLPGRLRWAFTGSDRKQAIQTAATEVGVVLDRAGPVAFPTLRYEAPTVEWLWADYAGHGADYAALLEAAGAATAPPVARARGGLAAEIADRVEATPLDPQGLDATLRGYQDFGTRFVIAQARVLLGDEMGLGKTIQALAAMCHLRTVEGARHFLVVAPASIVGNWAREITRRTDLTPHLLHGDADGRIDAIVRWVAEGGVGITSFSTLRNLPAPDPARPDHMRPALVVVDEAHYIKNPAAARSRATEAWLAQVPRVLLMSGTPLENRLDELTRLVGLAQPEVATTLGTPEAQLALVGADPDAFRARLSPVYLRRNQEDVLTELPERLELEEWVELSGTDRTAYRAAVAAGELMAMRQAATLNAAKLDRLAELLEEYRDEGRKVVVFSFFRKVLDAVDALVPTPVATITGDVPPARRLELIDEFGAEPGFGLLTAQIDAGGVGLNLQAASVVVLMEPQWKPSTEAQAIARAHRMGQTRRVLVHRLLARDAVDETLRELVATKQELFDDVARDSAVADASDQAVDPEANLRQLVIEREQARLAATDEQPAPPTPAG